MKSLPLPFLTVLVLCVGIGLSAAPEGEPGWDPNGDTAWSMIGVPLFTQDLAALYRALKIVRNQELPDELKASRDEQIEALANVLTDPPFRKLLQRLEIVLRRLKIQVPGWIKVAVTNQYRDHYLGDDEQPNQANVKLKVHLQNMDRYIFETTDLAKHFPGLQRGALIAKKCNEDFQDIASTNKRLGYFVSLTKNGAILGVGAGGGILGVGIAKTYFYNEDPDKRLKERNASVFAPAPPSPLTSSEKVRKSAEEEADEAAKRRGIQAQKDLFGPGFEELEEKEEK